LTLDDVGGSVNIFGFDPVFPSSVRLGEAFSIAAMAAAVGAAAIWKDRTGNGQSLSIDIRQGAHGINPELTFHPTIKEDAAKRPPGLTFRLPTFVMCGAGYLVRSGLKNSLISRARDSGCSSAAKCPPLGITVHRVKLA